MIKHIISLASYHLEYFLSCSVTRSCLTLCDPMDSACQASLSFTMSQSKLMSIESVMPSNHLMLCPPVLFLLSIFPSIRVFPMSRLFTWWPKYWNFSFSISPSSKNSWLVSFKIDWFDCLAHQGTPKSLLQQHNSKASILRCSAHIRTCVLGKS